MFYGFPRESRHILWLIAEFFIIGTITPIFTIGLLRSTRQPFRHGIPRLSTAYYAHKTLQYVQLSKTSLLTVKISLFVYFFPVSFTFYPLLPFPFQFYPFLSLSIRFVSLKISSSFLFSLSPFRLSH